jgi:hypothetical protein
MDTKCKQPISVNFSTQTVDEKESDKALFAFFDLILNSQPAEIKNDTYENYNETRTEPRTIPQAGI